MKIALDAMGGDNGIPANVKGAIDACKKWSDLEVILVGDEPHLRTALKKFRGSNNSSLSIHHTTSLVEMHESPVEACRAKPDASVMVCARLLSEGKADAMVSAGNSGATMTSSLFHLRRIPGISRPAIATVLPTISGECIVLDMGANVDCKPKHLLQFAIMGAVYSQAIFKKKNPTVGLLSIGERRGKGKRAYLRNPSFIEKQRN